MNRSAAERAAVRTGLITLPIGLGLLIAPRRPARLLGGDHERALRLIGAADLALVPGLLGGRRRERWLAARAGLNLAIGAYCLYRTPSAAGKAAAGAMLVATIADAVPIAALRRG